jgi:DNA (cytosine-5)-methyltransferase 1
MLAMDPTFIDLFAGIGGMRLAFERAGCRCVFGSEIDKFSRQTYAANFGDVPHGDITKIASGDIPPHDILVGGFPCQPFSISGVSKANSMGRPHGFDDPTRGTLFFEIKRILEDRRPAAFLLENVKNLSHHDGGRTMRTILNALHDVGYATSHAILDAKGRVPQHRERTFIVGFLGKATGSDLFGAPTDDAGFEFPGPSDDGRRLRDILDPSPAAKYTITDALMECMRRHRARHEAKGNGFGYTIAKLDGFTATLKARYYKDGAEILVPQDGKNPRKLTPRECARLQGFPESFEIVCSDVQAYRQFGNSVAVPLVEEIARRIVAALKGRNAP